MTVLVTGASRGVGRAIAERILDDGGSVLAIYREAHDEAEALRAVAPDRCRILAADLFSAPGQQQVATAVNAGQLEGAVFNAGTVEQGLVTKVDVAEQVEADLTAPLELLQLLLRGRAFTDPAALVFITSNLARRGLAGAVAYSAAKAGVEGAVRSLARELGPDGVRVNAVAPGLLRTDMTAGREAELAEYAHEVPLGRVGTADDVAAAVTFLLGPRAAYITGQVLDVDGGWAC